MMRRITTPLLVLLAALLLAQAGFSLRWPITHDEAPLFYEAFLMQAEGRLPYRDIFDFQMPGSFAAYSVLAGLSDFDAVRVRLLDLLILSALLVVTFFAMRRFGRTPALMAALLFGLKYLQGGPSISLQRDYLFLIFLGCALWIGMLDDLTPKHRIALGLLFGLAASLKPHASLGLLPILLFDISDLVKRRNMTLFEAALRSVLPAAGGFSIPIFIMAAWLAFTGSLTAFLDIAANYWPLYAQINGQMEVSSGAARGLYILDQVWRLGGSGAWLIPACMGTALSPQNLKRPAYLLASLAVCYAAYPAFSGQFFPYHYIPFIYFIVLSAGLCWMEAPSGWRPAAMVLLLAVLLVDVRPSSVFMRQIQGRPIATSTDRADEIALFLGKNLEAGDTVQPLDWTGGSLLAMLQTRAPIATPYVFDFYFYHHVSQPYIRAVRLDFMKALQQARPRFVVEVVALDKPWVSGPDTSRQFPELRAFLNGNYSIRIQKDDYLIYERK